MAKPVVGYVAGLSAPAGRRMGHAGAIISAFGDSAAEKAAIMRNSGLDVATSPSELGTTMERVIRRAAPRSGASAGTSTPGPTASQSATPA
jgi:malate-CoA ligase subunit alpha